MGFDENLDVAIRTTLREMIGLLVERYQMSREDAYRVVQSHAMEAWKTEGDFRKRVAEDPEIRAVLKDDQIAELFRLERYLTHVDAIFARVFGPDAEGAR